jgi:hypothetical protein
MDLQQANMPRTPFHIYELSSKNMSFLSRSHACKRNEVNHVEVMVVLCVYWNVDKKFILTASSIL